jgi:hypothetical protein
MVSKKSIKSTFQSAKKKAVKVKNVVQNIDQHIPTPIRNVIHKAVKDKAKSYLTTGLMMLMGAGDYHLYSNSLLEGHAQQYATNSIVKAGDQPSRIRRFFESGNSVRIREREYLGDVISSGTINTFKNTSFALNPTNTSTFPWLSNIASLYEQWEPHGIVFEYVSSSSEFNGSSQGLGTVVLATEYNALDPPFATKQVMENSDFACSVRPSVNLLHGVECDEDQRPTKLLYTNQDNDVMPLNFSSLGNFQVASTGVSVANVNLGELWVSYDISFYKKSIENIQSPLLVWSATGTSTSTLPLGTTPILTASNTAGIVITPLVGTGDNFAFPPTLGYGLYQFLYFSATTTFSSGFGTGSLVNCTLVSSRYGDGATGQAGIVQLLVSISAPGASIELTNGGNVSAFSFCVTDVPNATQL